MLRNPPFDIPHVLNMRDGTGEELPQPPDIEASVRNGRSEFFIRAQFGKGAFETHRGVGIYFRPPSRNGILTVSSNPIYAIRYFNGGVASRAITRAWLGFVIESFNASDKFFDKTLVTQREMILNKDISWNWGREEDSSSSLGFPINAQLRVDDSHFYTIWVKSGGLVRASSGMAVASVQFRMYVMNIIWSFAGI